MTETLYITEIFESIQGETTFAGLPTLFIRLSGCNLRCSWCDTPYSFKRGEPWKVDAIMEKVQNYGARNVCVTGGEPLLQAEVFPLMKRLCDNGYSVSLETGGSLSISEVDRRVHIILDIKCPGSGMDKKNLWENLNLVKAKDQVKFVIGDESDYDYAKNVCDKYQLWKKESVILFSPVHGELDPKTLVNWMLGDRLESRLNLQIHKYVWSPETIGV